MTNDSVYFLPFSVFDGIGPITFRNLISHFGSAESAWQSTEKDLRKSPLPAHLITKFLSFQQSFDLAKYLEDLKKNGISFIVIDNDFYPPLLKEISDPPFVLYIKAKNSEKFCASLLNKISLAVVGSRKMTAYGEKVTQELIAGLPNSKMNIVSGLAVGVDATAHQAAMENEMLTTAVLGCGLDIIYPPENKELAKQIVENHGALLSEVSLGKWVSKGIFPARNRIIAGLSKGTLIIEAAENSGSLITANFALESGREVFAVPGMIQAQNSKGVLSLLKKGATLVTEAADICQELDIGVKIPNKTKKTAVLDFSSELEKKIFELLTENGQLHINEMSRRLKTEISEISGALTILEIRGVVKNSGNLVYEII